MKKLKVNLDRPSLESKYIESKQNFDQVVTGSKQLKPPIWKNPWFYGPVGVASLALMLSVGIINAKNNPNDKTSTLTTSSNLPEDTKCIHTPFENVDEKYTAYKVDPLKEQTITLPSGTTIHIPKGSLMPSSPTEAVDVKIREFDNKAKAFVAGIPMDYQKKDAFESAGMIEIRGFQDGKEVTISPAEKIGVSLVLTKDPSSFTFWKLNEDDKKWEDYPAVFKNEKNKMLSSPLKPVQTLQKELLITEEKLTKNEIALKGISEPDRVEYNLPIDQNQRFDLDFDTHEFPELEKFSGMEFEVVSKKGYDKSFTKKTWSSVDLTKENEMYYASFSSKKDKFKIAVRPVLTGQKKEEAEAEFSKSLDFYQKKKVELEGEKKTLQEKKRHQQQKYDLLIESFNKEAAAKSKQELVVDSRIDNSVAAIYSVGGFRADFETSSFGVFNCDKPITYPEASVTEMAFSYSGRDPVEIVSAHIFDEKKDLRFSFGTSFGHTINDLGWFEKNPNTLVVVDKEGRLGYVLSFNSKSVQKGLVKVTLVEKKDINVDFIQKLINEKTPTS